jgi:hypothetical protein
MYSKKAYRALLISLSVCMVPPAFAAKGLSYSYADVGYQLTELDTPDSSVDEPDFDSVLVDASVGLYDFFALRGGFRRGVIDNDVDSKVDLTEFRAGGRGHYSVLDNVDVYVDAIYFNAKFNGDSTNTDIGGIYEAGFRVKGGKIGELDAAYRRVSGDIDQNYIVIGGVYNMTKNFGLSLNAAFGDDDDEEYFAGLRIHF